MATSEEAICNDALAYLNLQPITLLTADSSEPDRRCNQFYATARDALLQSYRWGFAEKYLTLVNEIDIVKAGTYIWTASGTEFYLSAVGPADPEINKPGFVDEDDVAMTEGTVGSLAAGEWGYGGSGVLGYDTIYVTPADGLTPQGRTDGYLHIEPETYSGWTYSYFYPDDCLIARAIYNQSMRVTRYECGYNYVGSVFSYPTSPVPFTIVSSTTKDSKYIVTNEADAELMYTAKITDVTMFPTTFSDALAWAIAERLSISLTNSTEMQAQSRSKKIEIVAEAMDNNATEEDTPPNTANPWIEGRL